MPSKSGDGTKPDRSRARSPKPKQSYLNKTKDGRGPRRSPVRKPGTNTNEIFGVVDDAIEHGAKDDFKKKLASARAALNAPIPSKRTNKNAGNAKEEAAAAEAKEKAEKEAKRNAKKKEAARLKAEEEEGWKKASIGSEKAKKKKEKAKKEAKRKAKVKSEEEARRKAQRQARIQADGGSAPVERIPKRSALLAMGGKEAEENQKKAALEALATWKNNAGDRWQIVEHTFDGSSTSQTKEEETITITISKGIEEFNNNPEKYVAMHYWPEHESDQITYVLRAGTTRYRPEGIRTDGSGRLTILRHMYKRLEPFEDNILPPKGRDKYTDDMSHQGRKLNSDSNDDNKPILPGRGMGIGDAANMKLIGAFPEPADVWQGSVGDCWLLSAIACLADFDWAVKRLFRKTTPSLEERPLDEPNLYTVTLWDLKTWTEVDVVVDERLPVRPDGSGYMLGAKPSKDGKLWVPYLEKAIAAHCGGWDKLEGGKCIDAWPMMTGCRNQFLITKNPKTRKYICCAKYNPNEQKWSEHTNSSHDSDQACWRVDWPNVGGGGDANLELTEDELFQKVIVWDENNYLIGAGTDGASDKNTTNGVVDNHAYSIIDSRQDICGTGIDLLLVRNPWGKGGEIENGQFVRSGPGWDRYPDIRDELNPVMEDNGLFWVTKEELFHYFPTIYLCAFNMTRLQDKNYVNDLEDDFKRRDKKTGSRSKTASNDEEGQRIIVINKESDPSSPYKIVEQTYSGSVSYSKINKEVIKATSIAKGVDEFRVNPEKYLAIHYQTSTVTDGWPDEMHQFTYIYRDGTKGIELEGVTDNGNRTILTNVLR